MTEPAAVLHDAATDREYLIERMLRCAKAGDLEKARALVDEVVALQEAAWRSEMERIASEWQSGLESMQVDERLADWAHRDIPDAKERLDFVIAKTEEAAHETMSALEAAMPALDALRQDASTLREADGTSPELSKFLDRVIADGGSVYANLSHIMMAKAFQDITGQVIRNVIGLVQDLEKDLSEWVCAPDEHLNGQVASQQSIGGSAGYGPAALKREKAERISGQDDVDDLLSQLGV